MGSGHQADGRGACALLACEGPWWDPQITWPPKCQWWFSILFFCSVRFFLANANYSFSRRKPLGCSVVGTEVGVHLLCEWAA